MSDAGACKQVRLELGAYLVGASGAADRSAIAAHLACCPGCRGELAELAGLPGLLSRVPAESLVLYSDDGRSCAVTE